MAEKIVHEVETYGTGYKVDKKSETQYDLYELPMLACKWVFIGTYSSLADAIAEYKSYT